MFNIVDGIAFVADFNDAGCFGLKSYFPDWFFLRDQRNFKSP